MLMIASSTKCFLLENSVIQRVSPPERNRRNVRKPGFPSVGVVMVIGLKEACGVVGAYSTTGNVVEDLWHGMLALQHRGQEGNGAFTFDGSRFFHRKALGLVDELENYRSLQGRCGIGHVRYSTTGLSPLDQGRKTGQPQQAAENSLQPFFLNHPKGGIALCHNGNLVNYVALRQELTRQERFLCSDCDAEVILEYLAKELSETRDLEKSISRLMEALEGAYSTLMVTGERELVAFRDPHGFRPLCYGRREDTALFSSESVALDAAGAELISDVRPGEMIIVNSDGDVERKVLLPHSRTAHCMFEYVYFSRPDSIIDGGEVYPARIRLGQELAATYETDADVIVPVPDTARPAAEGIARQTGIEISEGLIKNRYIGRTFIMPGQSRREDSVALKLNPVKSILKDRKVILVDDSIVRGTTSRRIVSLVRTAKPKSVEFWVTCPPIISPCFYGIDISTHEELIAARKTIPEIAETLNVDRVCYQTLDGLVNALGLHRDELCMACLTGEYPTPLAQDIADKMRSRLREGDKRRYWERELPS
jgi:amidophosphoribosyltransferase